MTLAPKVAKVAPGKSRATGSFDKIGAGAARFDARFNGGRQMRLRISHVVIALAALLIGFLLGLPHARAQATVEAIRHGAAHIGVPTDLPARMA